MAASAIFNSPYSLTLPKVVRKLPIYASLSNSQIICSRTLIIHSAPHLGITPFSKWNGLNKTGFSISPQSFKLEKRKKYKKGKGGVYASLFGVGAPEALVIGVVALLVFGPKGLAEVAKTLGKTLRTFQPTIRELQEVSREFKSTLEKEIGLDELKNPVQDNYTSNTARPPPDTLQNSQLTATPPDVATTTEDSQETTTTPAGGPEDSPEAVTTSDVSTADSQEPVTTTSDVIPEDSQETVTTSDVSTADSQEPVTSSDVIPEDSQETTAVPAVTIEDSQPTVDTTNGSPSTKAYSSEDLLKITEEQLKAVDSQQQKDQPASPENPKGEI